MRPFTPDDLSSLLQSANAALLAVSLGDGLVRYANPALAELIGQPGEEAAALVGQGVPAALAGFVGWSGYLDALRRGDSVREAEVLVTKPSGERSWALMRGSSKVRSGETVALLSLTDIDGRMKLQLEIQREREESRMAVARLEDELTEAKMLAHTDRLTGCWNRLHFDDALAREIARSDRHEQPLSMAIFDVDWFKRINDRYGHDVGDSTLKRIASIAKGRIRGSDVLARWGGEEFAVLLTQTALDGAVAFSEKLRSAIAGDGFGEVGTVTASFGVAERSSGESVESWFKRVDMALFRAKSDGRDRVIAWRAEDPLPLATIRFEWRDNWSSGDADIDEQHKLLLEAGNSLLDKSLAGFPKEELLVAFDRLLKHTSKHFASEESTLRALGYPGYGEHKRLHQMLLDEALSLKNEMLEGKLEHSRLFSYLVERVIVGHLLNADVKFFDYTMRNKGKSRVS
jgi:diguanylate cyclase (GGDEF)-like protein/hemerythrin-like metal-binding protein